MVGDAPRPLADVVELHAPSTVSWAPDATGGLNRVPNPRRELDNMFATIRRYEGVDQSRVNELVKQTDETLKPSLTELPGFGGSHLIDTGNGVVTSISFFDTPAHADESSKTASTWGSKQKLDA